MQLKQCVILVLFVLGSVSVALANPLGGTLSGSGPQSVTNPCNQEVVSGTVNFRVVTQAHQLGDLGDVLVIVTWQANQTGSMGNQYAETSLAIGAFNTLSNHYTIPTLLKYKGLHGAPSFTFLSDSPVVVDQNQKPTSVSSVGSSSTCTSD
jgi:hypothetical protein